MKEGIYSLLQHAGDAIIAYRGSASVSYKQDLSPLTEADEQSHYILCKGLKSILDIPILSEEDQTPYNLRQNWDEFWMIDPLDGTKDFLNGYDDFCINVALIKNRKPVLGAIYSPLMREFYYAEENAGLFSSCITENKTTRDAPIIAISRFHNSQKTQEYIRSHNWTRTKVIGAALKFGRMAVGEIDIYPRLEGSKEWDLAAGLIIIKEAGGIVLDLQTNQEPVFNKECLQNNYFVAFGPQYLERTKI